MKTFQGNNFENICDFTQKLTKKEKGDLFEEFTYYLFKLDPRLNQNLENIWLYKNIPNKILKELSLPTKDKGIDLLAKIDGNYCAIQCKFRQNPELIISWAELSTFFGLSFGLNNKIKGGFLVTNTYDLCEEVINSTKVQPIYGDFFDGLPKNFFDCIHKSNTKIIYVKKKPFLHQQECITNCKFHFIDFDRAHIEMACGSGKTLTAYWIDNAMLNKKTIVFVPSLYLLSQFYTDWVNQSYAEKIHIKYLLIGSDADVDEETKYKSNGLFLHTDPKEIKKYIKNVDSKLVIISTYQSSNKLAEACKDISFDFAFFDEAHKTVGQINKKFTMMLTDQHLVIKKRLFMTATPKIYSGDLDSEEIISMDNKKFYGEKIFTYNTGQAIADKKLVDYQVLTIYAKNSDIEKDIKNNKLIKYKDEFVDKEANYLGIILVLLKKIHDGTCRHMITYHNRVKRATKFRNFLVKISDLLYDEKIFVDSLDGSTTMGKRTKIIKEFINSPRGVICSAKVLNVGVNIPIVDSVCFVDPKFSTIDIVQCIGRGLRLYPGKELANIIVPTFIDDFNDEFDKNVYGNVIRILKALKTTDDGVVEYFKMKANGKIGGRVICANEYCGTNIDVSKDIDLDKWHKGIETKIWNKYVTLFDHECPKCFKMFDTKSHLNSHLKRKKPCNIKKKKKICPYCNKPYATRFTLNRHIDAKHADMLNNTKNVYVDGDYYNVNPIMIDKFINKDNITINNYFTPHSFGKKEIDNLSLDDKLQIFTSKEHPIIMIVLKTNLNRDTLEYHNVGYFDLNSDHGCIFNGRDWIKKDIKPTINKMMESKNCDLSKIGEQLKDFLPESGGKFIDCKLIEIKKIVEPLFEMDVKAKNELIKNIKTLLFNNQHLVYSAIKRSGKNIVNHNIILNTDIETNNEDMKKILAGITIEELHARAKQKTQINIKKELAKNLLLQINDLENKECKSLINLIDQTNDLKMINIIIRLLSKTYCFNNEISNEIIKKQIEKEAEMEKMIFNK
jgi:superfamily II DNA or RNA helicase